MNQIIILKLFSILILSANFSTLAFASGSEAMGFLDGIQSISVGSLSAGGWACIYGQTDSVTVQIYAGNPSSNNGHDPGVLLTSTVANLPSEPGVAQACGTNGNHYRFIAPITPTQLANYKGKTVYATVKGTTAVLSQGAFTQVLPNGAGSAENVNKTHGFNLLVDCSVNQGLNCSSGQLPPSLATQGGNPSYAYGTSIVHYNGVYYNFFCSVGINNGWDSIRLTTSKDGIHWSTPVVKLAITGAANQDFSACDPSVVHYDGVFYLYYGSAYLSPKGNTLTVIQVARSTTTIDGDYQIYAADGTWGATASHPPKRLITPYQDAPNSYGSGQPTVVVNDGKLYMWYTDDTYSTSRYGPGQQGNIFMLSSTNPVDWSPCHYDGSLKACPNLTNTGEVNVDVKYNSSTKEYVMYSLDTTSTGEVINTRLSTDGLSWSSASILSSLPNNPFPFFGQNPGVSGDEHGQLIQEPLLVTYMAPFLNMIDTPAGADLQGSATSSLWSLYGAFAPKSQ